MSAPAAFTALGDEKFISLTTFRRSGAGVPTAVWIGRDGDALVVLTPESSGKVKRLRNNSRVEMRPCSRSGRVADGAPTMTGQVEILDDDVSRERLTRVIQRKYGFEYRIVLAIEGLSRSGRKRRVLLRITPA